LSKNFLRLTYYYYEDAANCRARIEWLNGVLEGWDSAASPCHNPLRLSLLSLLSPFDLQLPGQGLAFGRTNKNGYC
jgi:hypothetical protein